MCVCVCVCVCLYKPSLLLFFISCLYERSVYWCGVFSVEGGGGGLFCSDQRQWLAGLWELRLSLINTILRQYSCNVCCKNGFSLLPTPNLSPCSGYKSCWNILTNASTIRSLPARKCNTFYCVFVCFFFPTHIQVRIENINLLNTRRRLLYLKTQFVQRCCAMY